MKREFKATFFNCRTEVNDENPHDEMRFDSKQALIDALVLKIKTNNENYSSVMTITNMVESEETYSSFCDTEYLTDDNIDRIISFVDRIGDDKEFNLLIYEDESYHEAYQMCQNMRDGNLLAHSQDIENEQSKIIDEIQLAQDTLNYLKLRGGEFTDKDGISINKKIANKLNHLRGLVKK